jgi:hypothetical protein
MDPRRKNDLVQKQKQADILTHTLRYVMGTPGVSNPGYVSDIHIRPQFWVGNVREDSLQINHGMVGLGRRSVRGGTELDQTLMDPSKHPLKSTHISDLKVHEPRLVNPAWSVSTQPPSRQMEYSYRSFVVRPVVPNAPVYSRRQYLDDVHKNEGKKIPSTH